MSSPKVYIVIGISHSGKSSLVKNTFIRGRVPELKRDLMRYSELDDCILIGWYGPDFKRRVGTDNIERKHVGLLASQILNLLPLGKDIVLEGVKAISRPMMNTLIENGIHPVLICLRVSPETSANRWNQFDKDFPGVQVSKRGIVPPEALGKDGKKAHNFYNDFKDKLECRLIDTTNVTDFSQFSLDNLCEAEVVEEHHKEN